MKKDNLILSMFNENEERAFRALFDQYYKPLLLFATQLLQDQEVAKDVVQDVFIDFYVKKRFVAFRGILGQYMYQSVKHASINYIRGEQRRRNRYQKMDHREEYQPAEKSEEWRDLEILYNAINKLPEGRRKIFLMVCIDGMKYQEVADSLDISINTVRTQMGRSFKFLRETLSGQKFTSLLFYWLKKSLLLSHEITVSVL